ncbi:hypothetical protein [Secundilactobacillus similis]|uniref:Uncharacterized protein n=1 Tax=Secundilactobacillus similis DSM 23365 = JCM 2765 TaxID=1423804 RepID=A0A0R2EI40_9LACO|nr:hypothetical protein [Secundilactobacillus similis]KRN15977.1 hypothetical protein FD14_GL002785 [Secundilactobacillus similis DSM 23365 = JCM 2765]
MKEKLTRIRQFLIDSREHPVSSTILLLVELAVFYLVISFSIVWWFLLGLLGIVVLYMAVQWFRS